jgi:hypothetical protein
MGQVKRGGAMSFMDPDDQKFGHLGAEDQEFVDAIKKQGVIEADLPDDPAREDPRPGRKAEEP